MKQGGACVARALLSAMQTHTLMTRGDTCVPQLKEKVIVACGLMSSQLHDGNLKSYKS